MVSRSTTEAEHREMDLTLCEMMWPKSLLKELRVFNNEAMLLHCDNLTASDRYNK